MGGGGDGQIHMNNGCHIGILEHSQILNIRKIGNNMVNVVHIPDEQFYSRYKNKRNITQSGGTSMCG